MLQNNTTYSLLYCNIDTTSRIANKGYINNKVSIINVNPRFRDAGSYDLRLQDTSQCVDAGKDTLTCPAYDILGYLRDDYPDMGSYEF